MTPRLAAYRRHAPLGASARRAQAGVAGRGVIVAMGLVAAVALQLAGPRLQCRLADLMGIDALSPAAAPAMPPASTAPCSSPSGANPMHPCKVATATTAGVAPAI